MALTTTVSGASSDSYATVIEADSYLSWRDLDSWENATEARKEGVLKAAVWILDELLWEYPKASLTQALRLPMSNMTDTNGDYYIPERVKRAQAYLAAYLLEDPDLMAGNSSTKQVSVPGAFSVTMQDAPGGSMLPADVMHLIDRYLYKGGPTGSEWDSAARRWK